MLARTAFTRFFTTTARNLAEAEKRVSKEALMALRKRTGYSYVNCRKALVQFGENDMDNAEKWLRELAAKEGWAKAAKVGSRVTANGLVSVINNSSTAAVVELTCETDFVARADHFKNLLQNISESVLAKASTDLNAENTDKFQEHTYELADLTDASGKNLREVLSLAIGKLGENMSVKKLRAYKAPTGTTLYGASHPRDGTDSVPMGRFVSLVALSHQQAGSISSQQLAGQICQHIIGMSPEKLGEAPVNKSESGLSAQEGHDPEAGPVVVTNIDDSETSLLRQSFMLNPSQTVHEYLTTHNAKVADFVRFELGNE